MVFPIADENTDRRTTPFVNYVLIGINLWCSCFCKGSGQTRNSPTRFQPFPQEIITGRDITTPDRVVEHPVTGQVVEIPGLQPTLIPVYFTLITSMFMHGGIAHIFGNMLFLWIFGDNIEDRLGHVRYVIFYLVCGVLASLAHVFTTVALRPAKRAC